MNSASKRDIESISNEISMVFQQITAIECKPCIIPMGSLHKPTRLESNEQGVYVFYFDSLCLKVGKAGTNSRARWNSHHYNMVNKTPSTLPKTLYKNLNIARKIFPNLDFSNLNVREWIQNNTSRIEFKIPNTKDKRDLNLLESIALYYLKPIFEDGFVDVEQLTLDQRLNPNGMSIQKKHRRRTHWPLCGILFGVLTIIVQ